MNKEFLLCSHYSPCLFFFFSFTGCIKIKRKGEKRKDVRKKLAGIKNLNEPEVPR